MDRYRHNIKKLNAKRKQQNIISYLNSNDFEFNSSFSFKRVETETGVTQKTMDSLKKRGTFGAKRFYNKPPQKTQTRTRSVIDSHLKAKAIDLKSKEGEK